MENETPTLAERAFKLFDRYSTWVESDPTTRFKLVCWFPAMVFATCVAAYVESEHEWAYLLESDVAREVRG